MGGTRGVRPVPGSCVAVSRMSTRARSRNVTMPEMAQARVPQVNSAQYERKQTPEHSNAKAEQINVRPTHGPLLPWASAHPTNGQPIPAYPESRRAAGRNGAYPDALRSSIRPPKAADPAETAPLLE